MNEVLDVLLQVFMRGGFLFAGVALTLALRPREETPELPRAVVRLRA